MHHKILGESDITLNPLPMTEIFFSVTNWIVYYFTLNVYISVILSQADRFLGMFIMISRISFLLSYFSALLAHLLQGKSNTDSCQGKSTIK